MTNAEARFNKSLRPRKPEGSLGRTAQDGHLDSHTAPKLCPFEVSEVPIYSDTVIHFIFPSSSSTGELSALSQSVTRFVELGV